MKKVGTVSVDGTKIKANASKHSAISYGRAQKLLVQLEDEVAQLTEKAEQADARKQPSSETNLPEEIARRENRRSCIKKAMAVIEARSKEKLEAKKLAYEEKLKQRQKLRDRGKKIRGREPKKPSEEVNPKDQYNFTDAQSRIMKAGTGKRFEQCYNAQASVEVETMLIVSNHLSDQANDKKQLQPNLEAAKANGFTVERVLADTGYYSDQACAKALSEGVDPYVAVGRQDHGVHLESILNPTSDPPELPKDATAKERMAHKLQSKEGSDLYRKRKHTVEPVFGIIKHCMGFRQFLMRGKEKVSNEWNLVCAAYNLKRIFNLLSAGKGSALKVSFNGMQLKPFPLPQ